MNGSLSRDPNNFFIPYLTLNYHCACLHNLCIENKIKCFINNLINYEKNMYLYKKRIIVYIYSLI